MQASRTASNRTSAALHGSASIWKFLSMHAANWPPSGTAPAQTPLASNRHAAMTTEY